MRRYVLHRLLQLIPVLLITASISFFITNLMPGEPIRLMLGDFASEAQVHDMKETLGYNRPLLIRFASWLGALFQGDLGDSIFLRMPVREAIWQRLEPSMLLAGLGMFFGIGIGLPVGIISAIKQNTWWDRLLIGFSLIGISVPGFFIAIILIMFFGVHLGWFPVAGYTFIAAGGLAKSLHALILPGLSLGLLQSGLIARMTRSTMLDVLEENYMRTAFAKGLPSRQIYLIHALKNAQGPILTVIGFSLASLLGGTWIVETVFNIPGIGSLAIAAILRRDYPLIQGCLMFSVVIYLLVNLLIDLISARLNPRIRYE